MEEWKDIIGYEGRYQISNFGRVRSLARVAPMPHGRERQVKEKILQLTPHYKGYQMVFLYDGSGTDKKFFVHRLVGMHFLSKKEEQDVVNHKDLCKANNNHLNLEWATHSENIQHYWENRVVDEVF